MKNLNPNFLLLSLCLALSSCATTTSVDEPAPHTANEAFQRSEIAKVDGVTVVRGPRVSLSIHGRVSIAGLQAFIRAEGTTYVQRTAILGSGGGDVPITRADLESVKAKGIKLNIIGGETISFSPAYIIGFLRRVDSVRKP